MDFFESFIVLFTFLLLNVPVFISLYRHIFGGTNIYIRCAFGILYWSFAFVSHELAPFLGILILLSRVHGKNDDDMQIRGVDIWNIGLKDSIVIAGWALVFKIAISQLNRLYVYVMDIYLGMQAEPQEIVKEFAVEDIYYKMLLFVLVVILAPFVEEYIFRYYIYDKLLLPKMPAVAAAIISSALFTLLHLNVAGIPTFFGLGLYCTFVYERKGFYGAVITHLVSNLLTAALLM